MTPSDIPLIVAPTRTHPDGPPAPAPPVGVVFVSERIPEPPGPPAADPPIPLFPVTTRPDGPVAPAGGLSFPPGPVRSGGRFAGAGVVAAAAVIGAVVLRIGAGLAGWVMDLAAVHPLLGGIGVVLLAVGGLAAAVWTGSEVRRCRQLRAGWRRREQPDRVPTVRGDRADERLAAGDAAAVQAVAAAVRATGLAAAVGPGGLGRGVLTALRHIRLVRRVAAAYGVRTGAAGFGLVLWRVAGAVTSDDAGRDDRRLFALVFGCDRARVRAARKAATFRVIRAVGDALPAVEVAAPTAGVPPGLVTAAGTVVATVGAIGEASTRASVPVGPAGAIFRDLARDAARTARVGLTAIDLLRPVPFPPALRPKVVGPVFDAVRRCAAGELDG